MQIATISSRYVKNMLEGAVIMGFSAEEILKSQGIPLQILTNPKLRISTLSFAKLERAIIECLRDETWGLLVKPQAPGGTRLVALACLASRTVGEAMQTWIKGINLLDNSLTACFDNTSEESCFVMNCYPKPGVSEHFVLEAILTTFHRFHCWLAREFLPIAKIELAYPAPSHVDEYRFLFYGAPVLFGRQQNALFFDDRTLALECRRNRQNLDELFENFQTKLLTQSRQGSSLVMRVRLWMERCFREGTGTAQLMQAAEHFELKPQTLRRRLKDGGTTFQQLKEEVRRDVAIHLINERKLSIEAIGFQLGYSESSTFIRAFKGWAGLTPLNYRKL